MLFTAGITLVNRSSSPGRDDLTPQHVACSHSALHVLLCLLFTSCLSCSYKQDTLSKAIIVTVLSGI